MCQQESWIASSLQGFFSVLVFALPCACVKMRIVYFHDEVDLPSPVVLCGVTVQKSSTHFAIRRGERRKAAGPGSLGGCRAKLPGQEHKAVAGRIMACLRRSRIAAAQESDGRQASQLAKKGLRNFRNILQGTKIFILT